MKKLFFDLFPVLLFFAAYRLGLSDPQFALNTLDALHVRGIGERQAPILLATCAAIVATLAQTSWLWLRYHRVEKMMLFTLALMIVFGGATLVFHDPQFIQWKLTIFYWTFALVLAVSNWVFGNNLLRKMLASQLELPETVWARLNAAWVLFLAGMGLLNLYVMHQFSEEAWVNFKLFGTSALMFLFILAQALYLSRHIKEDSDDEHAPAAAIPPEAQP